MDVCQVQWLLLNFIRQFKIEIKQVLTNIHHFMKFPANNAVHSLNWILLLFFAHNA
jgi:hypothetical protein